MVSEPTNLPSPAARLSTDLAGSTPVFVREVGSTLVNGTEVGDLQQRHLIFNHLDRPGRVHVYRADCRAGERLRVQLLIPLLAAGGAVTPSMAVVAQSLPYDGDDDKLPFPLPAGYSAVVTSPPRALLSPVSDWLTRVRYYPGPVIDTRTLVGGRCYIVVWSPQNQMGKYALHVGHRWPWRWRYWLGVPSYWWQIRGWFGYSRAAAYGVVAALALLLWIAVAVARRRRKSREQTE